MKGIEYWLKINTKAMSKLTPITNIPIQVLQSYRSEVSIQYESIHFTIFQFNLYLLFYKLGFLYKICYNNENK